MERYIAFDVETPNEQNNRMSAIGITIVEDRKVVGSFGTLVNPESYFNPFNIALTGITPEEAEKAPTFGELWETIEPILSAGILVAHNAPFDMGVMARCLRAYCLDWERYVPYTCTVRMTRAALPKLCDHKLNTLCAYWDIPLDHHRAESDSLACAEVLIRCLNAGLPVGRFLRTYDMKDMRTLKPWEIS